jgi:Ran GTPase-activating protein (RanGAP) involved in mRNA processing and transport
MTDATEETSSGRSAARGLLEQLRAEGRRVSGGDFSFDAESARRKLEEYRLPDPHLYLLEIVRAAHHLEASSVQVDVDANECELRIQGVEPPASEELDNLFARAFAPQTSPRAEALRHLALGVHGALGLDPEQIVVESRGAHGTATLHLDRQGRETLEVDEEARRPLLRIYVDQGVRLSHLGGWVRGAVSMHPEERVLRERCLWGEVAIYSGDDLLPTTTSLSRAAETLDRTVELGFVLEADDARCAVCIFDWSAISDPSDSDIPLRVRPVVEGVELDPVDTGLTLPTEAEIFLQSEALEVDASGLRVVEDRRWRRALHGLVLPGLRACGCSLSAPPQTPDEAADEVRPTSLDLCGTELGGAEGVRRLEGLWRLAGLEELDLFSCGLGEGGARALTETLHMPGLEKLRLAANHIGDEGAAALAGWSRIPPGLRELDLSANGIGEEGARALASSPHLEPLTSLQLQRNRLDDGGARALASSPHLERLENLVLESAWIGAEGIAALLTSRLPSLQRLVLRSNRAGDEIAQRLAGLDAPTHMDLRELDLGYCFLRVDGIRALSSSPICTTLTSLDLHGNAIGPPGAAALASSCHLQNLQVLCLGSNDLGDRGARELAGSQHLRRLTKLDLGLNEIGPAGAEALAASPLLSGLRRLDLGTNPIGPRGAWALAESPHLRGMRRLVLSSSSIGDEGARALASSEHLAQLEELWLLGSAIGPEGAAALAGSPYLSESVRAQWRR